MPSWLRLAPGSVDILRGSGACDDLSAILTLLLAAARIEAKPLIVMAPGNGHVATSVNLGKDWALVDLYFGVVFQKGAEILSIERLTDIVAAGHNPTEFAVSLPETEPNL